MISFGVAPAMLAFVCGMHGVLDKIVLGYFVACGVSRLARFNVTAAELCRDPTRSDTSKAHRFPRRLLLVALVTIAAAAGHVRENLWLGEVSSGSVVLHPLVILFAISGTLMISLCANPELRGERASARAY